MYYITFLSDLDSKPKTRGPYPTPLRAVQALRDDVKRPGTVLRDYRDGNLSPVYVYAPSLDSRALRVTQLDETEDSDIIAG